MKKGATMRKRVITLMKDLAPTPRTSKEISDIASHRWRWSPTVMQVAMICRTTMEIKAKGYIDQYSNLSRWRGVLWVYDGDDKIEEIPKIQS
jgi:hypothetical protein